MINSQKPLDIMFGGVLAKDARFDGTSRYLPNAEFRYFLYGAANTPGYRGMTLFEGSGYLAGFATFPHCTGTVTII